MLSELSLLSIHPLISCTLTLARRELPATLWYHSCPSTLSPHTLFVSGSFEFSKNHSSSTPLMNPTALTSVLHAKIQKPINLYHKVTASLGTKRTELAWYEWLQRDESHLLLRSDKDDWFFLVHRRKEEQKVLNLTQKQLSFMSVYPINTKLTLNPYPEISPVPAACLECIRFAFLWQYGVKW